MDYLGAGSTGETRLSLRKDSAGMKITILHNYHRVGMDGTPAVQAELEEVASAARKWLLEKAILQTEEHEFSPGERITVWPK